MKLEPWLRRYSGKKVQARVSVGAQISSVSRGRTLVAAAVYTGNTAVALYTTAACTLLAFSNWPDRELAPRIRKDIR